MSDNLLAPTSSQLLLASLKRHANRTAITVDGQSLTYAEVDRLSDQLAGFLATRGVGPGVAVAVHLRNSCEYVVSEFAILKLAAIRVPLNEQMGVPELGFCLDHSGAQILITNFDLPRAQGLQRELVELIVGVALIVGSTIAVQDPRARSRHRGRRPRQH